MRIRHMYSLVTFLLLSTLGHSGHQSLPNAFILKKIDRVTNAKKEVDTNRSHVHDAHQKLTKAYLKLELAQQDLAARGGKTRRVDRYQSKVNKYLDKYIKCQSALIDSLRAYITRLEFLQEIEDFSAPSIDIVDGMTKARQQLNEELTTLQKAEELKKTSQGKS